MFKIIAALRLMRLKIVYSCLDLDVISFVLVPEASASRRHINFPLGGSFFITTWP